ncbi:MAG: hypothetical protein ACFFDF_01255 [Candidatus Odinarchaeota archaeon]
MDELTKKLLQPAMINSQKYSVLILYVNPMKFNSPWSKILQSNGALLFKLWERHINALAKACKYVKYRSKI